MKRRNNKKTIMQQGGLMIEALAMLGLIAVVTPTMYKKSAERTMEVEDINSATTIRTIMNAANDYVGANYSTIISDMNKAEGDANKYRPITRAQIEPYLPYGFNMNKALYNYDFPELAIAKNDNNLTTFALFPAKANADNGIGQERTSRIASLVGASGGYVTESGKARGIGGIWKLEGDAFNKVFPTSGSGANEYSIVTASADTINAATGNEIDMDKYLQRGRDDPSDNSTLWKNTMRTDLYMGINKSDDDVYKNESPNKVQEKLYSIRNIKSLIVGVEKASQDGTTDLPGYGLYIEGSDAGGLSGNPNAFIRGSLRAAQEQFYVTDNKLGYGIFDDANFKFEIDKATGDTSTKGALINDKNVALANSLGNWDTVTIGAVDRYPGRADGNHAIIIKSSATGAPYGKLTLFDDDVMYVQNKGNNDVSAPDNDRIVMLKGGVKQLPDGTNVPSLSYNIEPTFPMRVGANAKFEGLVAAGQLDTQKIRAASLSVGSSKIDDANKWMTVDANGVLIANPDGRTIGDGTDSSGTRININKDQIALSVDKGVKSVANPRGVETSAHSGQIVLNNSGSDDAGAAVDSSVNIHADVTRIRANSDMRISGTNTLIQASGTVPTDANTKVDLPNNTLVLRNDDMQMKVSSVSGNDAKGNALTGAETVFSARNSANEKNTRTVFNRMHVDLAGSNLKVLNTANAPVFSVRGNSNEEALFDKNYNDDYIKSNQATADYEGGSYDVAMHGNVIIAPASSTSDSYANVSIGKLNKKAGINIISSPYAKNNTTMGTNMNGTFTDKSTNIVMIDQNGDNRYGSNVYAHTGADNVIDPGTVYIRKGYVEVNGDRSANRSTTSTNGAFDGNGVIVASRLVANNPVDDSTGDGYKVPQLIKANKASLYDDAGTVKYDTYMVNPAYTSVMHDIKLTTRGGARLSDVLPDFINKGIYVVNNTVPEDATGGNVNGITTYKDAFTIGQTGKDQDKFTLGSQDAWASPFLGAVPAPQCPPGYGRVITLSPAGFQMAQAGSLHTSNANHSSQYYVAPYTPSAAQAKPDGEPMFSYVDVTGSVDVNGTSKGITAKTAKYVLTSKPSMNEGSSTPPQPATPLIFQQSTWLKSMVTPLEEKGYTRGWAAMMGFLYPSSQYSVFADGADTMADDEVYWNLFPVVRGTLEGYATVYCYFNRTNMILETNGTAPYDSGYGKYVDAYTYMQSMDNDDVPTDRNKKSGMNTNTDRLNDPNLKYNEVW